MMTPMAVSRQPSLERQFRQTRESNKKNTLLPEGVLVLQKILRRRDTVLLEKQQEI